MSSPAAVVSNGLVRVIRPQSRFRPYRSEQVEEKSRLLSKMDAFYREAYRRLPAETMLDACFCIGLLDPVSNVMANALLSSAPDAGRGPDLELVDEAKLREEMGKRSIDGLVAFLLYLFPYLAGWEALRYLLVADADLLVAARIIVADRGMMRFSVTSPASVRAFKGALLLAAQVAKHPEPECLVSVWMSLSSQLQQCLGFLSEINYQSQNQEINFLSIRRLLDCLDDLGNAWDLAVFRPSYSSSIADMPYQATRSLRMALLDTIRGFYLQALARLPRHELHTRYYRRSLLRGGYCYGPLDPVSNIIINTIWHDVMLPAAEQPVLDMIGPNSLTRLESRSFYGLASFLQTRYHNLSEHEVLQCLVASCAYLPCVDRNLDAGDDHMSVANLNLNDVAAPGGEAEWQQEQCRSRSPGIYASVRKLEQQSPCTSTQEGYEAAATATWHRDPEAQAVFLSGCKALLEGSALSLLQTGDRLTSEDLQYIASLFCTKQKPAPERIEMPHDVDEKTRSEYRQRRVSRKVKAALRQNLLQDGEPMYELHVICSANVSVCGPEYGEDKNDPLSPAPCKFWRRVNPFCAVLWMCQHHLPVCSSLIYLQGSHVCFL
uniref:Uncharacterized protein n=1 Tax=Avena sativa TaxID=4498 RepID=A0ACD5ZM68_AVESA